MQKEKQILRKQYKLMVFLLVSFLVIFPKGGVKVAGIPLTWGYFLLGLVSITGLLGLLLKKVKTFNKYHLLTLSATLPFQVSAVSTLLLNGIGDIGRSLSLIISFVFIPWMFLFVFSHYLDKMDLTFLLDFLRNAIFLVALYGVFLFFYKLETGRFIEIPYLTVNADDVGNMENKFINRGGIFKLISTYNNGNIYGVSLLMLFPLYNLLEKSKFKKIIVNLSFILTLSRTVWFGLIIYHILYSIYIKRININNFISTLSFMLIVFTGIYWSLKLMGFEWSFVFDERLGGRIEQFDYLENISFFPSEPFLGIAEVVYLSVIRFFGISGFCFFMLAMCSPLVLHFLRKVPFNRTPFKKSLALGLTLYLIVSLSDGAMLLIPVMAFYWFIVALFLSNNPSFKYYEQHLDRKKNKNHLKHVFLSLR
ncbi:hypothetical protein [Aeribacillus sp. FSL M8-0254]|uniref:hypothetical protein n=1 Tax=Aeribacillus sp. FSL M8-0254 TaxID=2954577 RepID=UPI0030F8A3C2